MSVESSRKYTLIAATVASFLTPFMGSAINLAVPSIGSEFGITAFLLNWVVTSYILASAAFLLPFGRIADIVGRKKVFMLGILFFAISSALCGLSRSIEMLIFCRVLQGIASAMVFGTAVAILTSAFPTHQRGHVLGINTASVYLGLSLGPVLGGGMNHYLGWRSIFFFVGILGVMVLLLVFTRLSGEWVGSENEKFDVPGSFLYLVGLASLMYGVSSLTNVWWAKYVFLVGLVLISIFIYVETRVASPLLDVTLFTHNITFTFSNLAALVNYSATFAVTFLLSIFLQVVKGFNSQEAGIILLSQPVVMALLSPLAGNLSDRVEPRRVASAGMALTAAALPAFAFLNEGTPIMLLVGELVLLGVGLALFSSPNTNAVMGSVARRYFGVAASAIGTMRLVGQTVSMAVVTLVMTRFLGSLELNAAPRELLLGSTRMSFLFFSLLCFLGIFASLARGNIRVEGEGALEKRN